MERREALQARPPLAVDYEATDEKLEGLKRKKAELSKRGKALDGETAKLMKALGGRP